MRTLDLPKSESLPDGGGRSSEWAENPESWRLRNIEWATLWTAKF